MPIPDYQTLMLPLLQYASDEKEHSIQEAIEVLAKLFRLTDQDLKELLPSGRQTVIRNRVAWATTYLKKANLLQTTKRGYFRITPRGLDIIQNERPATINVSYLKKFQEFNDFYTQSKNEYNETNNASVDLDDGKSTPEEILESSYQKIRETLASELITKVKSCSPYMFEKLVVDLLVRIGYGGSLADAGKAVGKSGDGGIDGIIKEDRLGLDVVYIQAKRWEGTVGRPEIHKFVGALQGHHAKKGVFITTSNFSKEAFDYASIIDSKIVLIDGVALVNLMIDYNLGVSTYNTYELKKIDQDYFQEEN